MRIWAMGDWRRVSLEAVAEIRSSNVDKKPQPGEEPIRLCNYMDVYTSEYITKDIDFMEATATPSELSRFRINSGDVMITKDSETPDDIGVAAVATDEISRLVCGYHLALIKPNRDEVDPVYLAKQLSSVDVSRYFGRSANGSTRYGLSSRTIAEAPLRLAPLREQQRVGKILWTIDEVIKQTEALVGKIREVKSGVLNDVFSRGLDLDRQLRQPRDEAPRVYKESPLGWIPKEWGWATLGDLISPGRPIVYGILMPGPHFPGGVPVIKVKDIAGGEVNSDRLLLTSPEIDAEYQRSKLRAGDLLLTIRGTVGRVAQVPGHLDGANITQDTARIGIVQGNPDFYRYYLETDQARRHLAVNTVGQAVRGINLADVRTTPVPLVPEKEQSDVADILSEATRSLRNEMEYRDKLEQIKRGLMDDLLMGRVRANADTETAFRVAVEDV